MAVVVSQIVARVIAVAVFIGLGVLLFNTFVVIEKRNPINILSADELDDELMSKLVLEYFRRKDECPEVEEKVEIVDAGPEFPGQKTRSISVIDTTNPSAEHKFSETGEKVAFPSRAILTCPDLDENLILTHMKEHNMIKHEAKHVITEEIKKKISESENFKLQEFLNTEIFHDKPGYFFEYRAHHKEFHESATIHLEANLGWSGFRLDPRFGSNETEHGGESYSAGCLREDDNIKGHYKFFNRDQIFEAEKEGYHAYEPVTILSKSSIGAKVQCLPLKSYISALERNNVDLLVLNSFGTELEVLRNAELSKISVKVVAVRSHKETQQQRMKIMNLMKKEGYKYVESPASIKYQVFKQAFF